MKMTIEEFNALPAEDVVRAFSGGRSVRLPLRATLVSQPVARAIKRMARRAEYQPRLVSELLIAGILASGGFTEEEVAQVGMEKTMREDIWEAGERERQAALDRLEEEERAEAAERERTRLRLLAEQEQERAERHAKAKSESEQAEKVRSSMLRRGFSLIAQLATGNVGT